MERETPLRVIVWRERLRIHFTRHLSSEARTSPQFVIEYCPSFSFYPTRIHPRPYLSSALVFLFLPCHCPEPGYSGEHSVKHSMNSLGVHPFLIIWEPWGKHTPSNAHQYPRHSARLSFP